MHLYKWPDTPVIQSTRTPLVLVRTRFVRERCSRNHEYSKRLLFGVEYSGSGTRVSFRLVKKVSFPHTRYRLWWSWPIHGVRRCPPSTLSHTVSFVVPDTSIGRQPILRQRRWIIGTLRTSTNWGLGVKEVHILVYCSGREHPHNTLTDYYIHLTCIVTQELFIFNK